MKELIRHTFADNQLITVAEALRAFAAYDKRWPIAIATGYFNLGGFTAIADVLEGAPGVRILIGAEPESELLPDRLITTNGHSRTAGVEHALAKGRDIVPFTRDADAEVSRLIEFLGRSTTEVRIFREKFLHGKAFIFGDEASVLAGSANFTCAGLQSNLELNLGAYDPDRVRPVGGWFDDLWQRSEAYDLAAVFRPRLEIYEPHVIYLRMLLAQYEDALVLEEGSTMSLSQLKLTEFQQLGSKRALRILDKWGGAILADGVGLGKTLIAGDVIHEFVVDRGLRPLVVCPASLRPMWQRFLEQQNLPGSGSVLSYAELARDERLGGTGGRYLQLQPDQYRLIVVDEAHALRNPDTLAYNAMVRLLSLSPQAKLLLLTATPVNNSLWDLYHELMLFAKTDARFATLGIPNLRDQVKRAANATTNQLDPSPLFRILDEVTVRRTRLFIKENFPHAEIMGPNGPVRIVFPDVSVDAVRYDLDALVPGLFERVAHAVEERLTMARYRAETYALTPTSEAARAESLSGLLRSQMLKRFESSIGAFRLTLARMCQSYRVMLGLIETQGLVPVTTIDLEQDLSDDTVIEELVEDGALESADAFDVLRLCQDLRKDIEVITELLDALKHVLPEDDPKLSELLTILYQVARQPAGDRRKVLVFTHYADTVEYIRDFLQALAKRDPTCRLCDRAAFVLGNKTDPEERAKFACGFSPRFMLPDDPEARDAYDILVTTDILAEGQNLQQCGQLVNFDLPWNPMRIAQRNGRIDRIGSTHKNATIHCFMPDQQLDAILGLEKRLQLKIAYANASIGVEQGILPALEGVERNFVDKVNAIQRLAEGDAAVIDDLEREVAFSGEEFREELRQALVATGSSTLESLPWGIGSGYQNGRRLSVVFLAKAGTRYVFRTAVIDSEASITVVDDLLNSLQAAQCDFRTERHYPDELRGAVYDAWLQVRADIVTWFETQRDPRSRQAAVPKVQRDAVLLLSRANDTDAAAAAEVLSTQWPSDVRKELGAILRDESLKDHEKQNLIVTYVRNRGLRSVPIEDLPDVRLEDVRIVCYQVVST